jgi:hypothetical protein
MRRSRRRRRRRRSSRRRRRSRSRRRRRRVREAYRLYEQTTHMSAGDDCYERKCGGGRVDQREEEEAHPCYHEGATSEHYADEPQRSLPRRNEYDAADLGAGGRTWCQWLQVVCMRCTCARKAVVGSRAGYMITRTWKAVVRAWNVFESFLLTMLKAMLTRLLQPYSWVALSLLMLSPSFRNLMPLFESVYEP